jgi:hypothetical protein
MRGKVVIFGEKQCPILFIENRKGFKKNCNSVKEKDPRID